MSLLSIVALVCSNFKRPIKWPNTGGTVNTWAIRDLLHDLNLFTKELHLCTAKRVQYFKYWTGNKLKLSDSLIQIIGDVREARR